MPQAYNPLLVVIHLLLLNAYEGPSEICGLV